MKSLFHLRNQFRTRNIPLCAIWCSMSTSTTSEFPQTVLKFQAFTFNALHKGLLLRHTINICHAINWKVTVRFQKCDWIAEMRSLSHLSFSLQSTLNWLIDIDWSILCSIFQKKKHEFLYIMSSDWLIWQSTVNDATMLRSWKRLTRKQQLKCMHFHSYFKFGFKIIIKDLLSEINLIVWLYVKKLIAIFILKFYFCIVW